MPSTNAGYMREYRDRNPEVYERQLRGHRAFRRALTALRACHRDEFKELLNAERAAVGLPPIGVLKPGPRRKDDAA
jgi:hypothetical protein